MYLFTPIVNHVVMCQNNLLRSLKLKYICYMTVKIIIFLKGLFRLIFFLFCASVCMRVYIKLKILLVWYF